MLKAVLSIVSIQLVVGQAFACIGNGESFNFAFREGSKPGELIVNMRGDKSDSFQEIVDDTGYVSVHLAVTRLAKEGRASQSKTVPDGSETLDFLKTRVAALDTYFSTNLDSTMKKPFSAAIEKLKSAINEKPAKTDALVAGISDLNGFLYESKIEIVASQRKSPNEAFSDEIPLNDIKLPSYVVTRSVGCNAGIGTFNTSIPKATGSKPKARTGLGTVGQ